jgi:hypothetical protein
MAIPPTGMNLQTGPYVTNAQNHLLGGTGNDIGYPPPPQKVQQQGFPLAPQQGVTYFGKSPAQSGGAQAVGHRGHAPAMKFGLIDGGCCSVPCAVAGCGIPIITVGVLAFALKSVIGKLFGGIKGIVGGIGNIAKKAAPEAGAAATKI